MSFRSGIFLYGAAALLCFSSLSSAQAAGFYLQESSISGLGYAFSGSTTSINDASTVYFNAAGMTDLDRAMITIGSHLLVPSAELSNDGSTMPPGAATGGDGGNPYSPTPVPNIFIAVPFANDFWAGLGITVPFGLANKYDSDWFGRFDSTRTELKTLNISPVVAYKVNDMLSVSGGIDIQKANAKLVNAITNVVSEGESKLMGDDLSFGYNLGATIKPIQGTEIGMSYRSAINHDLQGRIAVEGLSAGNFNIAGTAELDLPDIATVGIAQDVTDKVKLLGQVTWFGWSNFEDITAQNAAGTVVSSVRQGYENTFAYAIGAEYTMDEEWTFRAGYQFDETPTVDEFRTSRTPDGDRNWFTLGGTYTLDEDISIDFAGAYIDVADETINVSRNSGLATVRADTEGQVGIFSLGLNYKF